MTLHTNRPALSIGSSTQILRRERGCNDSSFNPDSLGSHQSRSRRYHVCDAWQVSKTKRGPRNTHHAGKDSSMNAEQQKWSELLTQAVTQPGIVSKAYSIFHNYSLGNMLAALVQCDQRGIAPGPIHTFNGWKNLNR